jgi:hypothetical protein
LALCGAFVRARWALNGAFRRVSARAESDACRMEAEYAHAQKKKMIPCMVEAGYQPDGWLGILLGSKVSTAPSRPRSWANFSLL